MRNWDIDRAVLRLHDAVLETALLPEVLFDLSVSAGGLGAMILGADNHLPGPSISTDMEETSADYFGQGWNLRDDRYRGAAHLLKTGTLVDQDVIPQFDVDRSPFYQDFLRKHDRPWFLGLHFRADTTDWCFSMYRGRRAGPFEPAEVARIKALAKPLSDAATLMKHLGQVETSGILQGVDLLEEAACLLDRSGRLMSANATAERHFSSILHAPSQSLRFDDPRFQDLFDDYLAHSLRELATTVVARPSLRLSTAAGTTLALRLIPLTGSSRAIFSGASLLLLIKHAEAGRLSHRFRTQFRLTKAEIDLASEIASGTALRQAALNLNIAYETARACLKQIYAKTDTHRQSELVFLINTVK